MVSNDLCSLFTDQWKMAEFRSRSPLYVNNSFLAKYTKYLPSGIPSTLRYLSTLLSLPACTEPNAQAGWEFRAFIWLSWEHCLGLGLYACIWSSGFPVILQRFSKPSHFEFFLLNFFIFTVGCPWYPKGPRS